MATQDLSFDDAESERQSRVHRCKRDVLTTFLHTCHEGLIKGQVAERMTTHQCR